ncbi:MAG: NADH-quinone oxidoreductase subunit C [Candidatus Bathyarchaeia archaeon]
MTTEIAEETRIVRKMKDAIGEDILEVRIPRPHRIFVHVNKDAFKKVIRYLTQKANFTHISTITGVDLGEEIEAIYHLSHDGRIEVSLKVRVPKDDPALPTVTDINPGAILYEREVHDLLGITFEEHPDLSPLVLPEGWPRDVYPLRKEWTIEKLEKKIAKRRRQ